MNEGEIRLQMMSEYGWPLYSEFKDGSGKRRVGSMLVPFQVNRCSLGLN